MREKLAAMRTELSAAYLVAALMGATAAHAQSQPSAVEIFKLRDMCQANAEKIADE